MQECRVCEQTLVLGKECLDYSTVVANIVDLETQCAELEIDVLDSLNAYCFKCRHITMSVPAGSTNQQICYLRSQVDYFASIKSLQLLGECTKRFIGDSE